LLGDQIEVRLAKLALVVGLQDRSTIVDLLRISVVSTDAVEELQRGGVGGRRRRIRLQGALRGGEQALAGVWGESLVVGDGTGDAGLSAEQALQGVDFCLIGGALALLRVEMLGALVVHLSGAQIVLRLRDEGLRTSKGERPSCGCSRALSP
jgi:hypothetical protein